MRLCTRGGLTWRTGIGGWYTRVGGVLYRAEDRRKGWYRWFLWSQGGKLEYRGTTFAEVAQQLVSDLCPFDHEEHSAACASDLDMLATSDTAPAR